MGIRSGTGEYAGWLAQTLAGATAMVTSRIEQHPLPDPNLPVPASPSVKNPQLAQLTVGRLGSTRMCLSDI
jgi:hypothetical protein